MAGKTNVRINVVSSYGHAALALVREYQRVIGDRLAAGTVGGLEADLVTWDGVESAARRVPSELKALTADQNAAAAAGHALVIGVREAIRTVRAPKGVLKSFGVGNAIRKSAVREVVAGLDSVIAGIAKHPEVARAAGVLPTDADRAAALRAALVAADAVQETKKAGKVLTVAERNRVAARIDDAVRAIAGVGVVHFHADPETAARFRGLVKRRPSTAKPKAGPAPAAE
jgi:hypothetical protein